MAKQGLFNTYVRFPDLVRVLQQLASKRPGLMQLDSIGKSFEGRDIWLATLTNFQTGAPADKPAMWVDGNIHAAELASSMSCLYFIDYLLDAYGNDPQVTRCLDTRVFYVCPRVNPDGAEWALADTPKLIRSSTRPYPCNEEPEEGLVVEDVDGDGRILTMRIKDPNGPWKIAEQEPRLLVAREPSESGGIYYRLLPEGRFRHFDGVNLKVPPKKQGLDLNRNFPNDWRGEHAQKGAGDYPTSEPEVRSIVQFIANHPNICAGVAFHTYGGVLLRPFSHRPDDDMATEDLWTYQTIGKQGSAITGYLTASAYHEFRYHPKEVITGALDDWLFEERGVFGWTVEIWSPQRQAGISDYKYIDWYRDHSLDDDCKMLHWNDSILNGQGFIDWYPYEHPQLGKIELGGWNALYSFWNPPAEQLQQEIARFPPWLVWHNLISPCLEILQCEINALENHHFHVRLAVHNTGWLPTYVTKQAQTRKLLRGVVFEITLAPGVSLVSGKPKAETVQLEGRAYKGSTPVGWAGQTTDASDDRVSTEWIVHAPHNDEITLRARHERAGSVTKTVRLD